MENEIKELDVQGLTVTYGSIVGVKDCSISLKAGEFVAVIGANGAGKSSILGAIAGICKRPSGHILFQGHDIAKWSTDRIVRHGVALCPEGRGIFRQMSVYENLLLGGYHSRARIKDNIRKVFDLFPILEERKSITASLLSGGQQQMLSIGRALMSEPKLLLLDEPSLGLAPAVVDEIFDAVEQLCKHGLSVLVAEESTKKVFQYANRVYVVRLGQIALQGTVPEIRAHPELVSAVFGEHAFQGSASSGIIGGAP